MKQSRRKYFYYLGLIALGGCSIKNIPQGDYLYKGAEVVYEKPAKEIIADQLTEKIEQQIFPKPNKTFLGLPIKLWLYNLANPASTKGISKFFKSIGEPPVLASQVDLENNARKISMEMHQEGFFLARAKGQMATAAKIARATYTVQTGNRWQMDTIALDSSMDPGIFSVINAQLKEINRQKPKYYTLDYLIQKRISITELLKENGYFYFDPNYLKFKADTLSMPMHVGLQLCLNGKIPQKARQVWRINKIIVDTKYSIRRKASLDAKTLKEHSFTIVDKREPLFKKTLFYDNIFLKPGKVYRYSDHMESITNLMSKNVFSFINVDFAESDRKNELDTYFLLSTLRQRLLKINLGGSIKSDGLVGSGVTLTHQNRNLFKQGEWLNISLALGVDYQFTSGRALLKPNASSASLNTRLVFPRLTIPFYKSPRLWQELLNPSTEIGLEASLLSSTGNYKLLSLKLLAAYKFSTKRWLSFTLHPISIISIHPSNISKEFRQQLEQDLIKKRAFAKQYIVSNDYTIRYDGTIAFAKPLTYKAIGELDLGGNLLGLVVKHTLAQYIKLTLTGIAYLHLSNKVTLANRLIVGYGYSYGNSLALPYVKQYYAGGPFSIRAFRSRMLGPGAYAPPNTTLFRDETGDIKLEFNTELRFPIYKMLKGAWFIDCGNIWTLRALPERENGKFSGQFLKQLGVGSGAGLRLDISFFIIRLDLGFPLYKPWLGSNGWVIKQINPFNSNWRKENLIYNFAIGYPF